METIIDNLIRTIDIPRFNNAGFVSQVLMKLIKENNSAVIKLAAVGKIFSPEKEGDNSFFCHSLCEVIEELTEKTEIPLLRTFGIKEDDLDKIAAVSDNKLSPIELSKFEITEILRSRL